MSEHISIGKIVATFGVKGEVILKHSLGKKTALKTVETVFIEMQKNSQLPYFVQSSKAKLDDEMYVKFEGIDTKERAHLLIQKKVWLAQEDFQKVVAKSAPLAIIGFALFNDGEKIGVVEEVIQQPHQVLLRINYKNKEALIPLHEETLDKIDRKKSEVHVTLPDGLLEVYL